MDFPELGSAELPDLLAGDEFVPVNMFFDSYVNELTSRTKRTHDGVGNHGVGKSARLAAGQTPGMGGMAAHAGMSLPPMPQPSAGVPGAMQPPFLPAAAGGQLGAGMQQHGMHGMSAGMPGLSGMPAAAPALNGGGLMGSVLPAVGGQPPLGLMNLGGGLPNSAGMGMPAGLALPLDTPGNLAGGGPAISGSLSGGGGGDDASGGCKGRKTLKQQEANKIAQQRYRERKKQKFHEMEETIEQLSKQLQALQALQSRNAMLEGLNSELQAQLVSREREVERLKVALDASADRSLGSHSQPSSPSANGADAPPLDCDETGCVTCDVLPRDLAGIDYQKGFSDQVERLRAFLLQHGMEQGDPPGGTLTAELMRELAQLVGRSCQLCQAALRAEGVKVMELISKDPSSFSAVGSDAEQQRWQACLDAMSLCPQQQEQLLLCRRSHLQHMRTIYQERHNLNMQAMALMLPHSSRNPAEDNTVEGRLASMSDAGYLPVAKSSAELGDVLDKIKDNLRREQRAVMDLNCQLMSKILTPLQGARYMLGAYPHHCDALALSNTLAKSLGREAVSGGAPANGVTQAGCGHAQASCC